MKNYLTISDFAGLRNVNINSLRYYERIGLLCPAYVDTETGYRYYSPDQLSLLDIILLCIDLEIPLKKLTEYGGENIVEDATLLAEFSEMADRKNRAIETGFKKLTYIRRCREEQAPYSDVSDPYLRELRTRYLYLEEYSGSLNDERQFNRRFRELFQYTQDLGLTPVMSAGFLLSFNGDDPPSVRLYHEVLTPDFAGKTDAAIDERLMKLPTMPFSCLCVEPTAQTDWAGLIRTRFPYSERRLALINRMVQYEPPTEHEVAEIQVLDGFQLYTH